MKTVAEIKAEIEKLKWLVEREQWKQEEFKKCFVIMPSSMTQDGRSKDYWTSFFEDFLTRSLADCGYQALRGEPTPGSIVRGIMEDLAWTDVVLAVLTDFNGKVLYELGVRHSLQRGRTVLICQDDQVSNLPFDLRHYGVADYGPSLDRAPFVPKLQDRLVKVGDETRDSPVSSFLRLGDFYCTNRALACLRTAMETLRRFNGDNDDSRCLAAVDHLNEEWGSRAIQLTVFKDDKVLCHVRKDVIGISAFECTKDVTWDHQSLYRLMRSDGKGIRLGGIEGYSGRITALAYDTLAERDWLVLVEAHLKQGGL
jgi:hypothetical protein